MIIFGDTQPKRGEPIPKGLTTNPDVYIKWYNSRPNRTRCSDCGAMMTMIKADNDIGMCVDFKHKPECDSNTEI